MKKPKISISYPPLGSSKGTPLLSQNRQFQWFSDPTYIYPVIPAYAATLLFQNGYEVFWDDGIAEELSYGKWRERLVRERPDVVAIETKTPVVKRHWKIIDELKSCYELRVTSFVLMGDHPTALPEESLQNSKVDYILTGGDYDFSLLNLANHLTRGEKLEGGFWYRNKDGNIENTGEPNLASHNLDILPQIDRELTRWRLYAHKNGNYKYTPGSYVMNARDCWWGQCSFCSWTTLFPGNKFRVRSVERALEEIRDLIRLGVKEIMEDSGTLPIGKWLEEFCKGMIERRYSEKVRISCNMRLNAIKDFGMWKLMRKAGFRMILFGLESVNQKTLDRINKNLRVEEVEPVLANCKRAGLEPHITVMVGYPWETKKDLENTLTFVKNLFRKGYIDSLQTTLVIPYPGTPLYDYYRGNNLLLTDDYDRFDQREPVMKTEMSSVELKKIIGKFYRSFITPKFIWRKLREIRSLNDLRFITRAGRKVLGHIADFS